MGNKLFWFMLGMKKFPLDVTLLKRRGNRYRTIKCVGRHDSIRRKNKSGEYVDITYLAIKGAMKRDKAIKEIIPSPESVFHQNIGSTDVLDIVQLDKWTYYPLIYNDNGLMFKAEVPEVDQQGNLVKDNKGKQVTKKKDVTILNTKYMSKDGTLIEIPSMTIQQTYDKEHWYASNYEFFSKYLSGGSFWEKYGATILLVICMFFIVMAFAIGINKWTDIATSVSSSLGHYTDLIQQSNNNVVKTLVDHSLNKTPVY